jgi:nitronate monooxygenase
VSDWPNPGLLRRLGITQPILQAPMAGAAGVELAIAVARAGGLGALPCAMLGESQINEQVVAFRAALDAPINLNFFCHAEPASDAEPDRRWRAALQPYYAEFGIDPDAVAVAPRRAPFDEERCAWVERLHPEVVSFHFGLPDEALLTRVKATGALVLASATTVEEARWLAQRGCDAVIAQGAEAGGHRSMFLATAPEQQVGGFALVPQIVDAVDVPVIAAGGIADARGIVAAFALGASAVQIGTAYLFCPEATIAPVHRRALDAASDADTALTNVFSGRPARGIVNRMMREQGLISTDAPAFPLAGAALAPLKAATEPRGSADFMSLWSGQAAPLMRTQPAAQGAEALTRAWANAARRRF